MDSQKRPMLALKIWERIASKNPNWKMIMIGDGDYLNILKIIKKEVIVYYLFPYTSPFFKQTKT